VAAPRVALLVLGATVVTAAGCGGGAQDAIAAAMQTFDHAVADHHYARACAQLTKAGREELASQSRRGCAGALRGDFRQVGRKQRKLVDRALRNATIGDIKVDGNMATATLRLNYGSKKGTEHVHFIKEDGAWQIRRNPTG
jgi:hypothetical protein